MRVTRCLPALALLLFLPARADEASPSARGDEAGAKKPPAAATPDPGAATGSSLTAARDPVTGALRPLTPEEARRLLGRRPLAVAEPQVVTLPNGTKMMRLGPEHGILSVARRNPDGTVSRACVHGPDEARAFLEAAPAPAPAPRER
jgi:hypothetical protein